jgi:FkbM family methyltransferase
MPNQNSLPFLMDTSSEIPLFRAETFWTKEPETIEWIRLNLALGTDVGVLVDVGANIGIYSLFASVINNSVPIIAVEPVSYNHDELVRNIKANNKDGQIKALQVALSRKSGSGSLLNTDSRPGSSGAQIQFENVSQGIQTIVKTGDEILNSEISVLKKNLKSVMIKIDTDGNELDVLFGFSDTFDLGLISSVLVETHPSNRDGIEEFMLQKGFCENRSYSEIAGHSDLRRAENGNSERTKIYSLCVNLG